MLQGVVSLTMTAKRSPAGLLSLRFAQMRFKALVHFSKSFFLCVGVLDRLVGELPDEAEALRFLRSAKFCLELGVFALQIGVFLLDRVVHGDAGIGLILAELAMVRMCLVGVMLVVDAAQLLLFAFCAGGSELQRRNKCLL